MPANPERQVNEYRDDHGVVITGLSLCVHNKLYPLEYISKCGVSLLIPNRKPGIFLLLLGLGAGLMAWSEWANPVPFINTMGVVLSHVEFIICVAAIIVLLGLIELLLLPKIYIVWIIFEGREIYVLESRNRIYAKEVAAVLSRRLRGYNRKSETKEVRSEVFAE